MTGVPMNCKMLSDPAGSPCSAQGILEALGRVVSPGDWDSTVNEVMSGVLGQSTGHAGQS